MADLGYTPAGAQRGAAVVTGAARGLGLEIARGLSARGYTVLLSDLDAEAARAAAAAIALTGSAMPLDVRDAAACRELARHAAGLPGGLQVWVNNAGVLPTGPAWEHDPDTRRLVLEVNALGTINGTLAAVETMRQAGQGHIVDGDVELGVGVSIAWTPGHTDGNHSLVLNTHDGVWVSSENGVAIDNWQPELSKIPGVREYAERQRREVCPNANTLEDSIDQYDSMVKEKTLADFSARDPRFKQILPSSELVAWKRQWPIIPTHHHGPLRYGQLT